MFRLLREIWSKWGTAERTVSILVWVILIALVVSLRFEKCSENPAGAPDDKTLGKATAPEVSAIDYGRAARAAGDSLAIASKPLDSAKGALTARIPAVRAAAARIESKVSPADSDTLEEEGSIYDSLLSIADTEHAGLVADTARKDTAISRLIAAGAPLMHDDSTAHQELKVARGHELDAFGMGGGLGLAAAGLVVGGTAGTALIVVGAIAIGLSVGHWFTAK